jgi:hypothetical protein
VAPANHYCQQNSLHEKCNFGCLETVSSTPAQLPNPLNLKKTLGSSIGNQQSTIKIACYGALTAAECGLHDNYPNIDAWLPPKKAEPLKISG